jgi:hypothetical protein
VAKGVDVPSSSLLMNKRFPAAYRTLLPSGIQVASCAMTLASRSAVPPPVENVHSGCSDSGDRWLRNRSVEPSGDRSKSRGGDLAWQRELLNFASTYVYLCQD